MLVRLLVGLGQALFALGVYGLLTRRNAVGLLLSIELLLNAAAMNFVLFGRLYGQVDGQVVTLFIIALAACEAVAALAIILNLYHAARTINADDVRSLSG